MIDGEAAGERNDDRPCGDMSRHCRWRDKPRLPSFRVMRNIYILIGGSCERVRNFRT